MRFSQSVGSFVLTNRRNRLTDKLLVPLLLLKVNKYYSWIS